MKKVKIIPYKYKKYSCNINFYYEALNQQDALEAADEFAKIQKQEAITQALQHNQDFTAYYRQMRGVDAGTQMQAVRRFRRRH